MKKSRSQKKPEYQLKIARERIAILFKEAEKILKEEPIENNRKNNIKIANRYVRLARKIGMRYNIRIPRNLKIKTCKHCYAYFKPGLTCKWSLKKGTINIKCFNCGKIIHYPYKQRK